MKCYCRDPYPLNFPKIWGWSPHVPKVCFPIPMLLPPKKFGEHCILPLLEIIDHTNPIILLNFIQH